MSRLVLAMLLAWMRERPLPAGARDGSPQPKDKPRLRSLAVSVRRRSLDAAPAAAEWGLASRARVHTGGIGRSLGAPSPREGQPRVQAVEADPQGASEAAGQGLTAQAQPPTSWPRALDCYRACPPSKKWDSGGPAGLDQVRGAYPGCGTRWEGGLGAQGLREAGSSRGRVWGQWWPLCPHLGPGVVDFGGILRLPLASCRNPLPTPHPNQLSSLHGHRNRGSRPNTATPLLGWTLMRQQLWPEPVFSQVETHTPHPRAPQSPSPPGAPPDTLLPEHRCAMAEHGSRGELHPVSVPGPRSFS